MYPFYTGYQTNMALHQDDIDGVRSLYGLWPKRLFVYQNYYFICVYTNICSA